MTIAIVYVALCIIVAWIGANRKFGFWGYFFCSVALTPIIGFIVLCGSDKRPKMFDKCPRCSYPLCEKNTNPH